MEFSHFGVFFKIPLFLRKAQTIDKTIIFTFLDSQIEKAAEKADYSMFCKGLFSKLSIYLVGDSSRNLNSIRIDISDD